MHVLYIILIGWHASDDADAALHAAVAGWVVKEVLLVISFAFGHLVRITGFDSEGCRLDEVVSFGFVVGLRCLRYRRMPPTKPGNALLLHVSRVQYGVLCPLVGEAAKLAVLHETLANSC